MVLLQAWQAPPNAALCCTHQASGGSPLPAQQQAGCHHLQALKLSLQTEREERGLDEMECCLRERRGKQCLMCKSRAAPGLAATNTLAAAPRPPHLCSMQATAVQPECLWEGQAGRCAFA
jgi:hypothetical protein